jgi:hypothetical protein
MQSRRRGKSRPRELIVSGARAPHTINSPFSLAWTTRGFVYAVAAGADGAVGAAAVATSLRACSDSSDRVA